MRGSLCDVMLINMEQRGCNAWTLYVARGMGDSNDGIRLRAADRQHILRQSVICLR